MGKFRTVHINTTTELNNADVKSIKDFLSKHIIVYVYRFGEGIHLPDMLMVKEDENIGQTTNDGIPRYNIVIGRNDRKGYLCPIRCSKYLGKKFEKWYKETFCIAFNELCEEMANAKELILDDLDKDEEFSKALLYECPYSPIYVKK